MSGGGSPGGELPATPLLDSAGQLRPAAVARWARAGAARGGGGGGGGAGDMGPLWPRGVSAAFGLLDDGRGLSLANTPPPFRASSQLFIYLYYP
jgi:hypothetical protein